jgi:hypothetical protein
MTSQRLIAALALPQESLVNQRVPKKQFLENGAPTAADRRAIQDGIEEVLWVAALKTNAIGVPAFRDLTREYLEIAVLAAKFRDGAKTAHLVELIHRAIPYPVALIAEAGELVSFSVAHKRFSLGEEGHVVLDEEVSAASLDGSPGEEAFLASLAVASLPSGNLFTCYQGWLERIVAFDAARITGCFRLIDSPGCNTQRRAALEEYARLEKEIAQLRAQATGEKQINRRVELNLEIKRCEERLKAISSLL